MLVHHKHAAIKIVGSLRKEVDDPQFMIYMLEKRFLELTPMVIAPMSKKEKVGAKLAELHKRRRLNEIRRRSGDDDDDDDHNSQVQNPNWTLLVQTGGIS
jgi:hypothetical protein